VVKNGLKQRFSLGLDFGESNRCPVSKNRLKH